MQNKERNFNQELFDKNKREEQKTKKDLLQESLRYIDVGNNPPHLISIVGPNRSGTTAFAEIFARLGIPNYLQPIKSIRRAIQENDKVPYFQLYQNIPLAVHKETLGSSEESEFFDPIETLLQAGYPAEKIHLIAMLRDPAMTLTSWNRIYQDKVNVPGLMQAIQQVVEIADQAESRGIQTTRYVHEMARDNDPETIAAQLFQRVGIRLNDSSTIKQTVNWTRGPRFGSAESTGIFYDQPPEIFVEGVKTRPGYQYDRNQQVNITPAQKVFLLQNGAYEVYSKFAQRAIVDTGLQINNPG